MIFNGAHGRLRSVVGFVSPMTTLDVCRFTLVDVFISVTCNLHADYFFLFKVNTIQDSQRSVEFLHGRVENRSMQHTSACLWCINSDSELFYEFSYLLLHFPKVEQRLCQIIEASSHFRAISSHSSHFKPCSPICQSAYFQGRRHQEALRGSPYF